MADASKIEWCDSTFNPWIGCTKVSAACDHCYAESWSARFKGPKWGNHPRQRTSAANWKKPVKWQREADAFEAEHGRPRFVFCASLADVFDNQVHPQWRMDLWELIRHCDRLVWLLLTKRPQNIRKLLPPDWGEGWAHVWLGTTVEDQAAAERNIPPLLAVPAARRFLSCEPLLGPVDLRNIDTGTHLLSALNGSGWFEDAGMSRFERNLTAAIDWVIVGGESGPNARPMHPDWARGLRDQCQAADTAFFFKQWGGLKPKSNGRQLDGAEHNDRPSANCWDVELGA